MSVDAEVITYSRRENNKVYRDVYTYNIGKECVGNAVACCKCVSSNELIGVQIEDD